MCACVRAHVRVCVRACVRACVGACMRACVCMAYGFILKAVCTCNDQRERKGGVLTLLTLVTGSLC